MSMDSPIPNKKPFRDSVWRDVFSSIVVVICTILIFRFTSLLLGGFLKIELALALVGIIVAVSLLIPFIGYAAIAPPILYGMSRDRFGYVIGPLLLVALLCSADAIEFKFDSPRYEKLAKMNDKPERAHNLVVFDGDVNYQQIECMAFLENSSNNRLAYRSNNRSGYSAWQLFREKPERGCDKNERTIIQSDPRNMKQMSVCERNTATIDSGNSIIYKLRLAARSEEIDDRDNTLFPKTFHGWWGEAIERREGHDRILSVKAGGQRAKRWISLINIGGYDSGGPSVNINNDGTFGNKTCRLALESSSL